MNKTFRKTLSLLIAFVLALTSITVAMLVSADDNIAITAENFPDAKFRAIITERYDTDKNGYLSTTERSVTSMSISGVIDPETEAIESVQGIEYFTNLATLRIGAIGLKSLDVSDLTNLVTLTCQGNKLTELDVSFNTKLKTLNCSDNQISELNLGSNVNLTTLYCYINKLTTLGLRAVPNLSTLRCDQNELATLDVSVLTRLSSFNCSYNHIPSLDLSVSSLTEVTDYMIGNQQLYLTASLEGEDIVVPFTDHGLTPSNYKGCSLDEYADGSGFEYDSFIVKDSDYIENGIEYYCDTGISGSEYMSVVINITRDFNIVKFYSNEEMTSLLGKSYALDGGSAAEPLYNPTEDCKVFECWSSDVTNVTEDMSVYPILKDNHSYEITAFDGVDTVTLTCSVCGDTCTLSFREAISTQANAENYNEYLDLVPDGYINAKDFAVLKQNFS